jgi:hypothetical protein
MDRETQTILQTLVQQWEVVLEVQQRMNQSTFVKPNDGWSVFRAIPNPPPNILNFELAPVVFNLPERAYHSGLDLYIVVEGHLSVFRDRYVNDGKLVTSGFSTEAGYFRERHGGLKHVYGAHYDFSRDELGHPVFHAQMKSFCGLSSSVQSNYGITGEVIDGISGIMKTVRLPTAQMDVFSFFVQLCADHLLWGQSGPEERAAFAKLLDKNAFLQGAGSQIERLGSMAAYSCYRASHWYPP